MAGDGDPEHLALDAAVEALRHAVLRGVWGLVLRCSTPSSRQAFPKPSAVKQLPRSVSTRVTSTALIARPRREELDHVCRWDDAHHVGLRVRPPSQASSEHPGSPHDQVLRSQPDSAPACCGRRSGCDRQSPFPSRSGCQGRRSRRAGRRGRRSRGERPTRDGGNKRLPCGGDHGQVRAICQSIWEARRPQRRWKGRSRKPRGKGGRGGDGQQGGRCRAYDIQSEPGSGGPGGSGGFDGRGGDRVREARS
jgi:hypothetical protein